MSKILEAEREALVESLLVQLKAECNFDEPLRAMARALVNVVEATAEKTATEIASYLDKVGHHQAAAIVEAGGWKASP